MGASTAPTSPPAARRGTIPAPSDRRLARGAETRRRITEFLVALLEDGEVRPTARAVAEHAGVSLRLVFHHFEDMNALYRSVMVLQGQRHWTDMSEVPATLPAGVRIERTVRRRETLFEAIGPVRRRAIPLAQTSDDVAKAVAESNAFLRNRLAVTFAPELEVAATRGEEANFLDAIDVVTSFDVWERLRRVQHLSPPAARRVTTRLLSDLVAGVTR